MRNIDFEDTEGTRENNLAFGEENVKKSDYKNKRNDNERLFKEKL